MLPKLRTGQYDRIGITSAPFLMSVLLVRFVHLEASAGTRGDFLLHDICNKPLKAELLEQVIFQPSQYDGPSQAFKCTIEIWSDEGLLFHFYDRSFLKLYNNCQNHNGNYIIVDLDELPEKDDKCSADDFTSPYLYRTRGYLRLTVAVNFTVNNNGRNAAGDITMDFRFKKTKVIDLCDGHLGDSYGRYVLATPGFPPFTTDIQDCSNRLHVGANKRLLITVLDVIMSTSPSDDCTCFVDSYVSGQRLCLGSNVVQSSFVIDGPVDIINPTVPNGGPSCAILLQVEEAITAITHLPAEPQTKHAPTFEAVGMTAAGSFVFSDDLSIGLLSVDPDYLSDKAIWITAIVVTGMSCVAWAVAAAALISCVMSWRRRKRLPIGVNALGYDSVPRISATTMNRLPAERLSSSGSLSTDDGNSNMGSSFISSPRSRDYSVEDPDYANAECASKPQGTAAESCYAHVTLNQAPGSEYATIT